MPIISYFPSSGGLKKLLKNGDVIVLTELPWDGSTTYSNNYSNSNTTYAVSSMFSSFNTVIKELYLPECSIVGYSAFAECSKLELISLPKCTKISGSAFACSGNIPSGIPRIINMPNCTEIGGSHAFRNTRFVSCNFFSNLQTIGSYAFDYCDFISSGIYNFSQCTILSAYAFNVASFPEEDSHLIFPICTSVGGSPFMQMKGCEITFNQLSSLTTDAFYNAYVKTINLPNVLTITGRYTFRGTTAQTINLPKCTTISHGAFWSATQLTQINLDSCISLYGSTSTSSAVFYKCLFSTLSLPHIEYMSGVIFSDCKQLKSLYLMGSVRCSITTSSIFIGTPFNASSYLGGEYGSIYVPASLLNSYKTATIWSRYSNRFVGI